MNRVLSANRLPFFEQFFEASEQGLGVCLRVLSLKLAEARAKAEAIHREFSLLEEEAEAVSSTLIRVQGQLATHEARLPKLEAEVRSLLCGAVSTDDHMGEFNSRMFQIVRLKPLVEELKKELAQKQKAVADFRRVHEFPATVW